MFTSIFSRVFLIISILLCFTTSYTVCAIESDFDSFESEKAIDSDLFQPLDIITKLSSIKKNRSLITTLYIYGRVHPGHHIYSVMNQGEDSPKPTDIIIENNFLSAISSIKESLPSIIMDESFEKPLMVHKNEFQFEQNFKLRQSIKSGKYQIFGYILYQSCTNRICSLPLKKRFETTLHISP